MRTLKSFITLVAGVLLLVAFWQSPGSHMLAPALPDKQSMASGLTAVIGWASIAITALGLFWLKEDLMVPSEKPQTTAIAADLELSPRQKKVVEFIAKQANNKAS